MTGALADGLRLGTESAGASISSPARTSSRKRLAYFAHDLNHADIGRRVDMLVRGGADVRVLGFHRAAITPASWVPLGRTKNAKLLQRAISVLRALATLPRWVKEVRGADVIVARNLEMLLVAAAARRVAARDARLIYECLDIHRLMSSSAAVGAALRTVERLLMADADGLMVSSPGFVREYFGRLGARCPKTILIENKVGVNEDVPPRQATALPPGPPWRIGWFGVIRCRRSLDILVEAARRNPGLLEVVIAGRAAADVVGDLSKELTGVPGVQYVGAFADEAELARLYRSVHFAWLVDFYEAGANSDWLLPNRLYRSVYYGAVPIALAHVETGRWLRAKDAGLLLDQASADTVAAAMSQLGDADYLTARTRLDGIPTEALVNGREDCVFLVESLG